MFRIIWPFIYKHVSSSILKLNLKQFFGTKCTSSFFSSFVVVVGDDDDGNGGLEFWNYFWIQLNRISIHDDDDDDDNRPLLSESNIKNHDDDELKFYF